MKKYFLTSAAALAFCGLFTSCTHDLGYSGEEAAQNSVVKTYEQSFVTAFGQPDPNQEWGFGTTSVAGVRGGTRAVPGITFPDAFSDKTDISEPGTVQKPSISESGAIVISDSQTGSQNYDNAVIYVKDGATLTLPDWASLQNTKFYLSSGCTLVAQNLYLKGSTEFVNDGGTIQIGSANNQADFKMENFSGTFWNNGTVTVSKEFTPYTDGGYIYNGVNGTITATKIYLFKNVELWNEGTITLTSEFNADQYGHKIYNSGTITTPKIILQKETVLWNEGTITAANSKEIDLSVSNDAVQIYNGTNATLKLETLPFNNNYQLVLNEGTLNVKGKITIPNNSEIVNYNTLTAGEFEMKSGGKFYNVAGGEVTIDGLSKIANDGSGNNIDNVWRNGGTYTTGSFEATGGCQNPAAFNNCRMYVTGQFFMNHSNFVLDGGAAVECGSFKWEDDNYFHMGGKALLKVTGQLLANNNDTGYGFYGDDTDYAVIKAGSIEKGSEGKFRAAYFGHLFIDTNSHFTQGENSADGTWYTFDDNVKFSFTDNTDVSGYQTHGAKTAKKAENFSITIPADNDKGCSPGYKYGDDPKPSSGTLRIICEDLSAKASDNENSDWDFNDVVFDIQLVDNNTKAKITLLAAGGTLPLCVGDLDHEVHDLFAEANPNLSISTSSMINTRNTGSKYTYRGCNEAVFYLDIDETWKAGADLDATDGLLKAVARNMPVQVYKMVSGTKTWVTMECKKGDPAAKIAVGTDYNWCDERTDIRDLYRASIENTSDDFSTFKLYVKNILGDGWYTVTEVTQGQINEY